MWCSAPCPWFTPGGCRPTSDAMTISYCSRLSLSLAHPHNSLIYLKFYISLNLVVGGGMHFAETFGGLLLEGLLYSGQSAGINRWIVSTKDSVYSVWSANLREIPVISWLHAFWSNFHLIWSSISIRVLYVFASVSYKINGSLQNVLICFLL